MPIRIIWSTDGLLCLSSATTSFWHSDAVRGPSTPTASRRSRQVCASSSTSETSSFSSREPYLREDHFSGANYLASRLFNKHNVPERDAGSQLASESYWVLGLSMAVQLIQLV